MNFRLTTRGVTVAAIVLTVVVVCIGVALAATSTPQFCSSLQEPRARTWRSTRSRRTRASTASSATPSRARSSSSRPSSRPCSSRSPSSPATTRSPSSATCSTSRAAAATPTRRCSRPVSKNGIRVQHKHLIEAGFLCMRCHSTQAHGDAVPEGSRTYPMHGPVPDLPQQPLQGARRPGGDARAATSATPSPTTAPCPRRTRSADWSHAPRRRRHPLHLQRLPHQEGRLLEVPQRHPHAAPRRRGSTQHGNDVPRPRAARPAGSATTPRSTARPATRCRCRTPRTSSPAHPEAAAAVRHARRASTVTCWPTARPATSSTPPATRGRTACSRASSTRPPPAVRRRRTDRGGE